MEITCLLKQHSDNNLEHCNQKHSLLLMYILVLWHLMNMLQTPNKMDNVYIDFYLVVILFTTQFCDLNNWTAEVPTPPDAPKINTLNLSLCFKRRFPNINKALQAVIVAYTKDAHSTGFKCFGLGNTYMKKAIINNTVRLTNHKTTCS